MRTLRPNTRRCAPGFTLLEVIVAVVIFGLTMVAVGAVMRTATRAWTTGHGLSEIMQGARMTEDVISRDMGSLLYLEESDYNHAYRRQIDLMATRIQGQVDPDRRWDGAIPGELWGSERDDRRRDRFTRRDRDEQDATENDPNAMLSLEALSTPIDLSFRGTDSGQTDRLSLARSFTPRWYGEPETWGVRRVSFYVEDGTLYREEEDPFGFEAHKDPYDLSRHVDFEEDVNQANRRFIRESLRNLYSEADKDRGIDRGELLPNEISRVEPLCDNVAIFDLTFGYFREGEWHEVGDWDSNVSNHRDPIELWDENITFDPNFEVGGRRGATAFVEGEQIYTSIESLLRSREPDNLPAYMIIQLGLQMPGGRGRIFSYTYFYAIEQAQETDVYVSDEEYEALYEQFERRRREDDRFGSPRSDRRRR